MKFWLGVTDSKWYRFLRDKNPEDVNFWQPSGQRREFTSIEKGAPFLFKLKAPYNVVGGVGFFSTQAFLPVSVAWDAFRERNGCSSFLEFKNTIEIYRKKNGGEITANPVIGCLILTNPIFFRDEDLVSVPENWSGPIVQGKTYSDDEPIGRKLWDDVQLRMNKYNFFDTSIREDNQLNTESSVDDSHRYKENVLSRVRLGQGAFRIMITQAYQGRCAVTGEHTLPVLEAAHIKPFSESGPHMVSNGILLRSDLHKLFDTGYITISPDYRLEVSPCLKEEFDNGKIYYEMKGRRLLVTPDKLRDKPNMEYLRWHNETVYRAS
jgi:putative restriction endonuclease